MFSTLGNLFLNRPREAERADARLDIRRHDPEQEKRKPGKNHGEEARIFTDDDDATVSVQALRVFLTDFLKSGEDSTQNQVLHQGEGIKDKIGPQQERAHENPAPQSEQAARAAGAYGAASKAAEQISPIETVPPDTLNNRLSAEEIRTIYWLIDNLKELSARNISYLKIERNESFLQSLVQAVNAVHHASL